VAVVAVVVVVLVEADGVVSPLQAVSANSSAAAQ
jgi:hypothetical protein